MSALFGSMAFFSAVMAPLIFIKLEPSVAGAFIRQVFPWYYLVIICLSAIAALALTTQDRVNAALLVGVVLTAAFSRQVLMPRINRTRDAAMAGDAAADARFARLHRFSVWINAAQILAIAVVLFRVAANSA